MVNQSAIRILVLDDDSFTLKLLARMLENLGYTAVSTRDNGRAALELVDSPDAHPDLILLDLNMPEMDGVEFVRHLAGRRYTGSLILLSGEDEQMLLAAEKLVRAHNIPALGHLRKPVKPEGLAALIEKWAPPQSEPRAAKKIYGADEVRAAIANGELVNYYQPKVSLANGRVAGMETLVRWLHPEDGVVLPGQFIGVAEAHGLIGDLTHAVLTGAFAQARAWQDERLAQQISVNVSVNNLISLDFADSVAQLAAKAGVPPQMVVLEAPEGCLMQEDMRSTLLENMTRLRLKRFRLSVDDFGTGSASLLQLRETPFDELKIDRHCVHRAGTDEKLRVKYDYCLDMAKKLSKETVAEGVEDLNDFNHVRRTGCEFAQGYFIAKPMPAADLPAWKPGWQKRWSSGFSDNTPESG